MNVSFNFSNSLLLSKEHNYYVFSYEALAAFPQHFNKSEFDEIFNYRKEAASS